MLRVRSALLAVFLVAGAAPASAQGRPASPACAEVESFAELDFWLGEWDVLVNDQVVGHNRIEKILEGCAVMEHWTDSGGGEGKSLFYHIPATGDWKQVWVTGNATRPGGVKEKTLVERPGEGAVRFQGRIQRPNGSTYLDRTTLTPSPDGTVRQVIELSTDEGETWRSVWDSVYRRKED